MKKFEFKITIFEGNDHFWQQDPDPQDLYEILYDCLDSCGFKEDLLSIKLDRYSELEREEMWH